MAAEGERKRLTQQQQKWISDVQRSRKSGRPADSDAPLKTSRGMQAEKFKRRLPATVQEHRHREKQDPTV